MKNLFLVNYILITVLLVGCYVGKSVYVGAEKDGEPHGQGTMTWNYGEYVGEWKEGKQHGQGTYTYPDGHTFIGQWVKGKKHGQGAMYWGPPMTNKKTI